MDERMHMSQRLTAAGVRHRYEEFDDNHFDFDYRMYVNLLLLYKTFDG
jgi:hypothetical protein